jgi:transcriptional regulator with XRE-family HTH domain
VLAIRHYRVQSGLSQNALAVLVHTSQRTISLIEQGYLRPKEEMLDDIAVVLGVTHAFLLLLPLSPRAQNPVGLTPRDGSTPSSGTSLRSLRRAELRLAVQRSLPGLAGQPPRVSLGSFPHSARKTEFTVVVGLFDLQANPHRQLGQVEVPVGADAVRSETTPRFSIRVSRVIGEK